MFFCTDYKHVYNPSFSTCYMNIFKFVHITPLSIWFLCIAYNYECIKNSSTFINYVNLLAGDGGIIKSTGSSALEELLDKRQVTKQESSRPIPVRVESGIPIQTSSSHPFADDPKELLGLLDDYPRMNRAKRKSMSE